MTIWHDRAGIPFYKISFQGSFGFDLDLSDLHIVSFESSPENVKKEKKTRATKISFCGRGLNTFFFPLEEPIQN